MSENTTIEDRNLTEPIRFSASNIKSPLTVTLVPDFGLSEADYVRLTKSRSSIKDWAVSCLLATFGGAILLGGKFIASLSSNSTSKIEIGEIWAVVIGLVIAIILAIFSHFLPSDKSKVLNEMEKHFSSSPRHRRRAEMEE